MRLIMKTDLIVHDGWLVDGAGQVVALPDLVDEVNSIFTLDQHITFAKANAAKIEALAKGETIEFKRPGFAKPAKLESGITVATPLKDAAKAEAEALAAEWLTKQTVDDTDKMLSKFEALAAWLEQDYVLIDETDEVYHDTARFLVDPRTISAEFVVNTIKAYCDPDTRKLVNSVVVTR